MFKINTIPSLGFAVCELCSNTTPVCEECYSSDFPTDVGCAYCHNEYGCEM